MPDTTGLLRQQHPVHTPPLVTGYVSTRQAAPTGFSQELYVILPDAGVDYTYGPCKWGALHGNTLPAQGAETLVAFDSNGVPVVVWWDGPHS